MNFKTLGAIVIVALAAMMPVNAQDSDSSDISLDTDKAKLSYSLGAMYGDFIKDGADLVDLEIVMQAIIDVVEGKKPALEQTEIAQLYGALQQQLNQRRQAAFAKRAAAAKEDGIAFLAGNGKKEGVITTASGLQYKVITEGSGTSPSPADTVVTHYEGTLIDGMVFDSSYARNQPFTIRAGWQVIKGWKEALALMKPGSKWELYIPSDLAYGERDSPKIPSHSALIFTIELLEVKSGGLTIR